MSFNGIKERPKALKRIGRLIHFFIVMALIFGLSTNALTAKERRGSTVRVTLKSGAHAQGELIAVRQDSLLILDGSGQETSFDIGEVLSLRVSTRKKRFPAGFAGFVAGAAIGYTAGANPHGWPHDDDTRVLSGVGLGLLCGVIGAVTGSIVEREAGRDATSYILLEGMSDHQVKETLARLNIHARRPG
jgi:hypothetical protein